MENISIKEYFEKLLEEKDRRLDVIKESAEKAVQVAHEADEKRLNDHNGLIQKMEEQAKHFARKDDVEMLKLWKENSQGSIKIILWLVGIGVAIVTGTAVWLLTSHL